MYNFSGHNKILSKITTVVLSFILVLTPLLVSADSHAQATTPAASPSVAPTIQATTPVNDPNRISKDNFRLEDGAGNVYPRQDKPVSAVVEAAETSVTCGVSVVLGNIATQYVSGLLADIAAKFASILTLEVPTADAKVRAKDTGTLLIPPLDSIGYCIVNTIIDHVTNSTIEWINNGFEGKPTFVDNPKRFFQTIADIETANALTAFADGILCEEHSLNISLSILEARKQPILVGNCTLDRAKDNIDSILSGETFTYSGFDNIYRNSHNNQLGAFLVVNAEINSRIIAETGSANKELGWGKGFLSWKDADGNTVTPGNVVETQLAQTLGISKDRLGLADEFDEIMTALVNQLIKSALNETLGRL